MQTSSELIENLRYINQRLNALEEDRKNKVVQQKLRKRQESISISKTESQSRIPSELIDIVRKQPVNTLNINKKSGTTTSQYGRSKVVTHRSSFKNIHTNHYSSLRSSPLIGSRSVSPRALRVYAPFQKNCQQQTTKSLQRFDSNYGQCVQDRMRDLGNDSYLTVLRSKQMYAIEDYQQTIPNQTAPINPHLMTTKQSQMQMRTQALPQAPITLSTSNGNDLRSLNLQHHQNQQFHCNVSDLLSAQSPLTMSYYNQRTNSQPISPPDNIHHPYELLNKQIRRQQYLENPNQGDLQVQTNVIVKDKPDQRQYGQDVSHQRFVTFDGNFTQASVSPNASAGFLIDEQERQRQEALKVLPVQLIKQGRSKSRGCKQSKQQQKPSKKAQDRMTQDADKKLQIPVPQALVSQYFQLVETQLGTIVSSPGNRAQTYTQTLTLSPRQINDSIRDIQNDLEKNGLYKRQQHKQLVDRSQQVSADRQVHKESRLSQQKPRNQPSPIQNKNQSPQLNDTIFSAQIQIQLLNTLQNLGKQLQNWQNTGNNNSQKTEIHGKILNCQRSLSKIEILESQRRNSLSAQRFQRQPDFSNQQEEYEYFSNSNDLPMPESMQGSSQKNLNTYSNPATSNPYTDDMNNARIMSYVQSSPGNENGSQYYDQSNQQFFDNIDQSNIGYHHDDDQFQGQQNNQMLYQNQNHNEEEAQFFQETQNDYDYKPEDGINSEIDSSQYIAHVHQTSVQLKSHVSGTNKQPFRSTNEFDGCEQSIDDQSYRHAFADSYQDQILDFDNNCENQDQTARIHNLENGGPISNQTSHFASLQSQEIPVFYKDESSIEKVPSQGRNCQIFSQENSLCGNEFEDAHNLRSKLDEEMLISDQVELKPRDTESSIKDQTEESEQQSQSQEEPIQNRENFMVSYQQDVLIEQQFQAQNVVERSSSATEDISMTVDHIIPPSFVEQKQFATKETSQISLRQIGDTSLIDEQNQYADDAGQRSIKKDRNTQNYMSFNDSAAKKLIMPAVEFAKHSSQNSQKDEPQIVQSYPQVYTFYNSIQMNSIEQESRHSARKLSMRKMKRSMSDPGKGYMFNQSAVEETSLMRASRSANLGKIQDRIKAKQGNLNKFDQIYMKLIQQTDPSNWQKFAKYSSTQRGRQDESLCQSNVLPPQFSRGNVQSALVENKEGFQSFDRVSRKQNDTAITNERKINNLPVQQDLPVKFNFRKIMPISNNQSQAYLKSHSSSFIGEGLNQFQRLQPHPIESSATITVSPNITPIDSLRGFVPTELGIPSRVQRNTVSNLSSNQFNSKYAQSLHNQRYSKMGEYPLNALTDPATGRNSVSRRPLKHSNSKPITHRSRATQMLSKSSQGKVSINKLMESNRSIIEDIRAMNSVMSFKISGQGQDQKQHQTYNKYKR